ncbi:MAG: alanine--tRNA ligase [bacterium]|nr:alanine--tRNA ligase [bacterium]
MTANELRQKYLDFFKSKEHAIISSASLIPENDPSVLFTTAGMHPLVPYLLGAKHPAGARLANAQKCIRTDDIDEVGDATHHTFFEMMGNWSLGDYFKQDAIAWSWEFLIGKDWLNLDPKLLAVSVFAGDEDAPFDEESYNLWLAMGVPAERIAKLPKKNNWWGPAGQTGPCGPDTEIFYWSGTPETVPAGFNDDNELWVEIWNNVFMQYFKNADGSFSLLEQKNVDTGLGLERVLAILSKCDNYQTELFSPLIKELEILSGKTYGSDVQTTQSLRIIADHVKAGIFIIGDQRGVTPSNVGQGYVVRRLLRRAIVQAGKIGIDVKFNHTWMSKLISNVIQTYIDIYPELEENQNLITIEIEKETMKFQNTLENGLKEFDKLKVEQGRIGGVEAFNLYQSYGFPLELSAEIAEERGLEIDRAGFTEELKKHQDLSRTASAGKFKGGLADSSVETTRLHTAAHMLLAALRKVLGDHITQKGSNITAERLRFDFTHSAKVTPEEIAQVEKMINEAIEKCLDVAYEEIPLDEAKATNAHGVFDSKYGESVRVYTIGVDNKKKQSEWDEIFSREICGGPHVENIGKLGKFRIQKEEASSSGVRRIKAVLE